MLEDNWGEIDASINRGCLLMDLDRKEEAERLARERAAQVQADMAAQR